MGKVVRLRKFREARERARHDASGDRVEADAGTEATRGDWTTADPDRDSGGEPSATNSVSKSPIDGG